MWRVRWEGVRLPRASGQFPNFPRKLPELPQKVLSLWNLTAVQRCPGSSPDFPGSSPDFPGSSPDFPEVNPFSGSLTPSDGSQELPLNKVCPQFHCQWMFNSDPAQIEVVVTPIFKSQGFALGLFFSSIAFSIHYGFR